MGASIWSQEAPKRRCDTHEGREALIAPASLIGKSREDVFGRGNIAHDPEDDEIREEAQDMDYQKDAFRSGQRTGKKDIEGAGCEEKQHDHQSGLIQLREVGIRVLQQDQALHKSRCELCSGWTASDPA